MKNSPLTWFKLWKNVIYEKKVVSRVALSEDTDCSIWIIKALQKDFLEYDASIFYKDGLFYLKEFSLDKTISLSLQEELK